MRHRFASIQKEGNLITGEGTAQGIVKRIQISNQNGNVPKTPRVICANKLKNLPRGINSFFVRSSAPNNLQPQFLRTLATNKSSFQLCNRLRPILLKSKQRWILAKSVLTWNS